MRRREKWGCGRISAPGPLSCQPVGGGALVRQSSNKLVSLPVEKTPMRDTEIVLNSLDTDARETQTPGHSDHHDTNQRPRARGRGEHGSSLAAPSPRRQPRRRATRSAERRPATDARLTPGVTGAMTENSLDLFLRS